MFDRLVDMICENMGDQLDNGGMTVGAQGGQSGAADGVNLQTDGLGESATRIWSEHIMKFLNI